MILLIVLLLSLTLACGDNPDESKTSAPKEKDKSEEKAEENTNEDDGTDTDDGSDESSDPPTNTPQDRSFLLADFFHERLRDVHQDLLAPRLTLINSVMDLDCDEGGVRLHLLPNEDIPAYYQFLADFSQCELSSHTLDGALYFSFQGGYKLISADEIAFTGQLDDGEAVNESCSVSLRVDGTTATGSVCDLEVEPLDQPLETFQQYADDIALQVPVGENDLEDLHGEWVGSCRLFRIRTYTFLADGSLLLKIDHYEPTDSECTGTKTHETYESYRYQVRTIDGEGVGLDTSLLSTRHVALTASGVDEVQGNCDKDDWEIGTDLGCQTPAGFAQTSYRRVVIDGDDLEMGNPGSDPTDRDEVQEFLLYHRN